MLVWTSMDDDRQHHDGGERDTLVLEDAALGRGFIQLPRLVLSARNLSRDAKLLYAILLSYAWQEARCFPGYRRLCEDMQASENMVRKYMRELEAVHLLSQHRRGLGKTNLYTLHDLRTAKIEVQEPQASHDPELAKTAGKVEPEERKAELRNSKGNADGQQRETARPEPPELPHAAPPRGDHASPPQRQARCGFSALRDVLLATAPAPPPPRRPAGQPVADSPQLRACLDEISRDLGDSHHRRANLTRAVHLAQQAGVEEGRLVAALYEARAITNDRRRSGVRSADHYAVSRPMAYFFRVAEDVLGLTDAAMAGREGGKR